MQSDMEERASIPVTLPKDNPTVSYWQDPPDAVLADFLAAETVPEAADTVIIGSGMTGSCVAWNLLQKQKLGHGLDRSDIVMLEARQACSGATGRNGGHTKAASYRSFLDNKATHGLDDAIKIARLEYNNIKNLHSFAREHKIDCDLNSCDTVDIIYDQTVWNAAHSAVEAIRAAMPDELDSVAKYKFWTADEARDVFHCKGEEMFGAVSYEAGSLSAYKFVIGLLKMCLRSGLQLFSNTPAIRVRKGKDGIWNVETSRGNIRAKRVVLATNGYTGFLHEKFQGSIVPLRGQITAHRPGRNMPPAGLQTTYSFIYTNGYEYMIPRMPGSKFEGDIIMGGGLSKGPKEGLFEFGNTDDTTLDPDISSYLFETTSRYFGTSTWGEDHPDGRIRKEWTGIMGYSPDGCPFVGEVPGESERDTGLWVAAGFQGHGMVFCFECAKALVMMMVKDQDGNGKSHEQDEDKGGTKWNEQLDGWFPNAFRVTEERFTKKFAGRLH